MENTVIEGWIGDETKFRFDKGVLMLDIFNTGDPYDLCYWLVKNGHPVHVRVTIEEI